MKPTVAAEVVEPATNSFLTIDSDLLNLLYGSLVADGTSPFTLLMSSRPKSLHLKSLLLASDAAGSRITKSIFQEPDYVTELPLDYLLPPVLSFAPSLISTPDQGPSSGALQLLAVLLTTTATALGLVMVSDGGNLPSSTSNTTQPPTSPSNPESAPDLSPMSDTDADLSAIRSWSLPASTPSTPIFRLITNDNSTAQLNSNANANCST
ncbi:hypothetical protein BJ322DRAFT_1104405 [Thelephora terrestris]|uniref:Uncharacterized protein n=1 Tax=Thelephora terrestris TaxID=56493 RepID=A0A9P6HMF3_9AGAM|nr:hypothetical protein BJ322DRAFT_1104405 [Thelephora terrestris]